MRGGGSGDPLGFPDRRTGEYPGFPGGLQGSGMAPDKYHPAVPHSQGAPSQSMRDTHGYYEDMEYSRNGGSVGRTETGGDVYRTVDSSERREQGSSSDRREECSLIERLQEGSSLSDR